MLNPRCPNCSFVLVLLERRLKYKCSKCGKLFLKREIEDKTFRQWNVKQRELDEHNLKLERKSRVRRSKLSLEEKSLKIREYHAKNRVRINEFKRARWQARKAEINLKRRIKRNRDKKGIRILNRIQYWRSKQSFLAQRELKISEKNLYIDDLNDSFPTFGLSELLIVDICL